MIFGNEDYMAFKRSPENMLLKKVVVDYINNKTEQTAVYMPGGPEIKTASE